MMSDTVETKISLGLDAIFASSNKLQKPEESIDLNESTKVVLNLNINLIDPSPYQARKTFTDSELQDLASSIKSLGILQPLTVRKVSDRYELIAGERRLRASKLLGLETVPAILCDVSDEASMAFGLIENIQRENLNVMDEANAYKRLLDEFGLTHEKISEMVGKSRSTISNSLRLLNLSSDVKDMLINKKIEMGHARAILAAPIEEQPNIAHIIINNHYTVREAEAYINRKPTINSMKEKRLAPENNSKDLEDKLYALLGVDAKIAFKRNQSGIISIAFDSKIHLQEILDEIENKTRLSIAK